MRTLLKGLLLGVAFLGGVHVLDVWSYTVFEAAGMPENEPMLAFNLPTCRQICVERFEECIEAASMAAWRDETICAVEGQACLEECRR